MTEASTQAPSELAARLQQLEGEVARLGREQFRAVTLLEGVQASLDDLIEGREQLAEPPHPEDDRPYPPLAEMEGRLRLGLVTELLPVADAVAASIRVARELLAELQTENGPGSGLLERGALLEAWLHGALLTEARVHALLERASVRPIPTVGQPFDPHRHVAVAVEHGVRSADGTIVGEELRGYAVDDRILRHAEVVVARTPRAEGCAGADGGGDGR